MHTLARHLLNWYETNYRELPWRLTRDPYKIWLSEIILQQTRVDQGLPYYKRFIDTFPDIQSLASAEPEHVLRQWQGLGYYSRARNLHRCAIEIVKKYNGQFPSDYHLLIQLPGIGKYTAAAIASFAFRQKVAAVDGNVLRVISRLFALPDDVGMTKTQKKIIEIANGIMPTDRPDLFNQALMEFGALHCTPSSPLCTRCPVQSFCQAFRTGMVQQLPVKNKKIKKRARYFTYYVIESNRQLMLKQRQENDIWKGLFEFHLVEDAHHIAPQLCSDETIRILLQNKAVIETESIVYKHMLTHQVIFTVFYGISISPDGAAKKQLENMGGQFYSRLEVDRLPKPILIQRYLESAYGFGIDPR